MYMEPRKIVLMNLFTEKKRRRRRKEWPGGHSGGRGGWDPLGEEQSSAPIPLIKGAKLAQRSPASPPPAWGSVLPEENYTKPQLARFFLAVSPPRHPLPFPALLRTQSKLTTQELWGEMCLPKHNETESQRR